MLNIIKESKTFTTAYTPIRMNKFKMDSIPTAGKDVEKLEPFCITDENVKP